MPKHILVANRGEIAIRILRTAADLGIETSAVFATDDEHALHTRHADHVHCLEAEGVQAYLDLAKLLDIAGSNKCDAIHPGYGFLSESPAFAAECEGAGFTFIGPTSETLKLFGDKAAARALAESCNIPILAGISRATTLAEAEGFFNELGQGAVMLKAIAGGGGRGMRPVQTKAELKDAFARATSEAKQAFGSGELYVEELLPCARHIEVQIIGDGTGNVSHLWDRECSLQRQRQKLIEIAPAFDLPDDMHAEILSAAVRIGTAVKYRGVGTVEFLVTDDRFVFMEANARLQVEHTVTEEITGYDLVALQCQIADGKTLTDLRLNQSDIPAPLGTALQARVNLETMNPDGTSRPGGGIINVYEPPAGPGIRVDGCGYSGYATSPHYDSLLAKLIVRAVDMPSLIRKAKRALTEFRIEGARNNLDFLMSLLGHSNLDGSKIHTRYVEDNIADLLMHTETPMRYVSAELEFERAGRTVDPDDPLAVLNVPRPKPQAIAASSGPVVQGPSGTTPVIAPIQGLILAIDVRAGESVQKGQPVAILEALKMEHAIPAPESGVVREIVLRPGETIFENTPILFIEAQDVEGEYRAAAQIDYNEIRDDLAEVRHFQHLTKDESRPNAVAKRRQTNRRTARENIYDLCDDGTFVEYGPLVTASRFYKDSFEDLENRVTQTASDGMVMGVGRINSDLVGSENARSVAMSYDYTVLAGTQGQKNHRKQDRMFAIAEKYRLPIVLYTEGGGGRTYNGPNAGTSPIATSVGGLGTRTWRQLGKCSGLVPIIGVNAGFCFAGNVVLLGACDVIIATKDSSLGIGGPALIEGGGLGAYAPEEVGPVGIQEPNGVIDILVEDEIEATVAARKYLSYFQGPTKGWQTSDQRKLRHMVPENRRAVYNVRKVIETIADTDSMLELRPKFGLGMITALIRIEGRSVGVIANNSNSPTGGAIDSPAADKATRFMQLCEAFDIPILSLIDCPGNMVGPEAEKEALIRHCGRMYVAGANLTVPYFVVVLRKAYGLGALAMAVGSFEETFFAISWPTGEFAGMGLEGQIKLGRRNELAAIENIQERKARYDQMVDQAYAWSRALNAGTVFEVDDVIDPAETRNWVVMGLNSSPAPVPRDGKKLKWIDTW